jgi:hypothetical protein
MLCGLLLLAVPSSNAKEPEKATPTPTPKSKPRNVVIYATGWAGKLEVVIKLQQIAGQIQTDRQTAPRNKDGSFTVRLPGPGKYTIEYASGPNKGKLIKSGTTTKPGKTSIPAQLNGMN